MRKDFSQVSQFLRVIEFNNYDIRAGLDFYQVFACIESFLSHLGIKYLS